MSKFYMYSPGSLAGFNINLNLNLNLNLDLNLDIDLDFDPTFRSRAQHPGCCARKLVPHRKSRVSSIPHRGV